MEARSSITYWHPLRAPSGEIVAINVAAAEIAERKQVRRQAFDPFFTTRRHEGATGLGLHIVHSMVDRLASRAQEPSSG